MQGISIIVGDAAAAFRALTELGLPEAPADISTAVVLGQGGFAVTIGGQFLAVIPHAGAGEGGGHEILLEEAPAFKVTGKAAGIAFKRWPHPLPKPEFRAAPSVDGIDHIVALVGSIEQASSELCELGVTKSGAFWDYAALSARARLFDLGGVWLELNEPLVAGQPTLWGEANGVVGIVLRSRDVEGLIARTPALKFSRVFPVKAGRSGRDELITLGLVTQLRTDAFGKVALYIYQPFEKGNPSPKDIDAA